MAGQTPNSTNVDRVRRTVSTANYVVTHPEYQYWLPDWVKVRDCLAGQREVKRKTTQYLRKLPGQTQGDYEEFLHNAIYFNMVGQTLAGMTGQVFRRTPMLRAFPKRLEPGLVRFGKDGSTHMAFAKTVVEEQCSMGRYGVLVDAPKNSGESYAVGYRAEDILDWETADFNGNQRLSRVLLREYVRGRANDILTENTASQNGKKSRAVANSNVNASPYQYRCQYRELVLVESTETDSRLAYEQRLYGDGGPTGQPLTAIQPRVRGLPLDFLPFVFFGCTGTAPDAEKPPLLDIADLNLSHYKTYADLEHGRKYLGLPIFVAPGGKGDTSEYHIGPDTVWEVPEGSQPTILEMKGVGLTSLDKALATKEQQIAAIGGRLLPGLGQGISESGEQSALRSASEQSILLSVLLATQDGMSLVLRYWMNWRDEPLSQTFGVRYVINTQFLTGSMDARVMRAIQLMWESGLFPIEVLFQKLRDEEVLSDEWTIEMFTARMKDPEAFINNPDAQARLRGYANRKQELDEAARAKEQEFQADEIALQRQQLGLSVDENDRANELHPAEVAQAKAEAEAAKKAAAAPAGSPAASGSARPAAPVPNVPAAGLKPTGKQPPAPGVTVNVHPAKA